MSVTLVPRDLRRAVIERDGTRCLKCGVQCTPDWWEPTSLHIDHIKAEARGGPTNLANLQVLCRTCNLAKGTAYADYRKVRSSNGSDAAANWTLAWIWLCVLAFLIGFAPAAIAGGWVGLLILTVVCLVMAVMPLVITVGRWGGSSKWPRT